MSTQTIVCPHCNTSIPLGEALAQHTKKLESDLVKKLEAQQSAVFEEKLATEKKRLWAVAQQKALEKQQRQLSDLENQVKESKAQLAEAEKQELELRKKSRELEEKQRKQELELARKLDEERQKIADSARKVEAESQQLKLQEKDKQLELLKKTIEDLRRQSEQGSMQLQGEAQEDDLKQHLQEAFPHDKIEDVATGARGADLVQIVNGRRGRSDGTILWESKNTKAFSNSWLSKLKADQGSVQADVAVLVSQALPDGVRSFAQKSGIWIVSYPLALSLAQSLHFHLVELSKVRSSLEGQGDNAELLLQYFSSPQFKNRIENLALTFVSMKADLETEKRSFQRIWSKREKELEKMISTTAYFYGDLQGIVGGALPSIPQLDLPFLADGAEVALEAPEQPQES